MVRSREEKIEYMKQWRKNNPNYSKEWEENHRGYRKQRNRNLKIEVLNHYCNNNRLGSWCQCCGTTHIEFLTMDHINNNGSEHRKEINSRGGNGFYHWLKSHNFPKGYQVLCFNCNLSKGYHGYCPHKILTSGKDGGNGTNRKY